MIDVNKLNAIVDYHKNQTFIYGEFDAMQVAKDIVTVAEKYLRDGDEEVMFRLLSDHCPSFDYPFQIPNCNDYNNSTCKECWRNCLKE